MTLVTFLYIFPFCDIFKVKCPVSVAKMCSVFSETDESGDICFHMHRNSLEMKCQISGAKRLMCLIAFENNVPHTPILLTVR